MPKNLEETAKTVELKQLSFNIFFFSSLVKNLRMIETSRGAEPSAQPERP